MLDMYPDFYISTCMNCNTYIHIYKKELPKVLHKTWTGLPVTVDWCANCYDFKSGKVIPFSQNPGPNIEEVPCDKSEINVPNKTVYKLDPITEEILEEYSSPAAAIKSHEGNLSASHIYKVLAGDRHSTLGYKWRYANTQAPQEARECP